MRAPTILTENVEFTDLEIELRQSLLKGYSRVRQIEAREEEPLEPAECVLALLGDPQVLSLEGNGWKVEIPLVYVFQRKLGERTPERGIKHIAMEPPKIQEILTPYRRRLGPLNGTHKDLHELIVGPLRAYLEQDRGFLLDMIWAPQEEVDDHHYMGSENWGARRNVSLDQGATHWLFGLKRPEELPSSARKVNSLVRLTFPPSPRLEPTSIVTLVLGLAVNEIKDDGRHPGAAEASSGDKLKGLVRRLSQILMTEVPQLYDWLRQHNPVVPPDTPAPDWLGQPDRDLLHTAVDELHRDINRLAVRMKAGPEAWTEPRNGNNFLVAFKEMNQQYRAMLRYCLSIHNLHAFAADVGTDLRAWRAACEDAVKKQEAKCQARVQALAIRRGEPEIEETWKRQVAGCYDAIRQLFEGAESVSEVKKRLMSRIEGASYRLNLTPGYWVMNQGIPEVINEWLLDPRSDRLFHNDYPADLLVWESMALRHPVYYSPITDGVVAVGVCGVNADILKHCSAYELQQLIDESGGRFRRILVREELSTLRTVLRNRHQMLEGPELWLPALDHFRRLASYHFHDPYDFHTKIMADDVLDSLKLGMSPRDVNGLWEESVVGLQAWQTERLETSIHLPRLWRGDKPGYARAVSDVGDGPDVDADGYPGEDENDDFLGAELQRCRERGEHGLGNVLLHRLRIPSAPGASLLVMIHKQNNRHAHELMSSFVQACWNAIQDDDPWGVAASPASLATAAAGPQVQGVLAGASVFVASHPDDADGVRRVVERLRERDYAVGWWDPATGRSATGWYPELREAVDAGAIGSMLVMIRALGLGRHQETEIAREAERVAAAGGAVIPVVLPGGTVVHQTWPPFLQRYRKSMVNLAASVDDVTPLVEALDRLPVKVFVSYSHEDWDLVDPERPGSLFRFLSGLERQGFEFVIDRSRLIAGDAWNKRLIGVQLASSQIALVLLSQPFFNSPNCEDELLAARRHRDEGRLRIMPVRVSDAPSDASHGWLAELHQLPSKGGTVREHLRDDTVRDKFYTEVYEHLKAAGDEIRAAARSRSRNGGANGKESS